MERLRPLVLGGWFCLCLLLHLTVIPCHAQQPYEGNDMLNCYTTNASSVLGYACNGASKSCTSYLTFRAEDPYRSPVQIAYLLGANAPNISALNGIEDISSAPDGSLVIVPTTCSCYSTYYQHNASYTFKSTDETYFIVSNNTYQGLSACQAMMAQNPSHDSRNLTVGLTISVPLRCACPTAKQTASGAKYLLTYLVTWGDDYSTIATRFNASLQSILDANSLTSSDTIYPFTTLLVPLHSEPTHNATITPPPSSPPPAVPAVPAPPSGGGGSSNTWVFVGIGIGAGALVLFGGGLLLWWFCWRLRRSPEREQSTSLGEKFVSESTDKYGGLSKKSASLASEEIRDVIESLTVYKLDELKEATGSFGDDHRIRGSVYRAVINGDNAAIKRLEGDVSREVSILERINHANVIRLSGFCLHEGITYLVYELAERGSLDDWLHLKKDPSDPCLSWKQRIQIACDVADGLSYLHNYANPSYVHKDLKSSNILLDGDFRAKVANFGLARTGDDAELTRHVVGTQGYMAPEYLEHGLVSPKLDVFSFGVVMLELLSGKEAMLNKDGATRGEKGEVLLSASVESVLSGEDVRSKLKNFIDPRMGEEYPFDLAYAMAQLAKRCVARDPSARPGMMEVLVSLSAIYNTTLDWDPSDAGSSGPIFLGR